MEMIKILGISGSPRKDGNTDILVKEALKTSEEEGAKVEFIGLAGEKISPCRACSFCSSEKSGGNCAIDDDMQQIYRSLDEAHGIIIGAPVYFGTISAQLKAMFDRCFLLRLEGSIPSKGTFKGRPRFLLKNKLGSAIAVGGGRNGGQELAIQAIHTWMLIHEMILVGSIYQPGVTAVGIEKGDVIKDKMGLEMARYTGRRMVEVLNRFKGLE